MVDGSAIAKVEGLKRQRRSIAEKRRIVELAMQPGASIARVAREHGVNSNMVHYWRNLYRQGRLGEKPIDGIGLLPVSVKESPANAVVDSVTKLSSTPELRPASGPGNIYIEFPKIHLRVESGADAALLRVVLETLQR
jgi:transposase